MSNPHHIRGQRTARVTCHGKVYYASRKDAVTMMNHHMNPGRHSDRPRHRHGRPEFLRAYPCPDCGGWHLTKKKAWGTPYQDQ